MSDEELLERAAVLIAGAGQHWLADLVRVWPRLDEGVWTSRVLDALREAGTEDGEDGA